MLPQVLGRVEVQKDDDPRVWYCGHIVEAVNEDTLQVGFEHDRWQKRQYPSSRVRKPPKHDEAELEQFSPRIGEEVEVRIPVSDHAPPYWAVAVVKNIKHGFYFVARAATISDGASEHIAEKDQLRPLTPPGGLSAASLRQETYKLPSTLQTWATSPDATGCFCHIEEQASLALIQIVRGGLKLIGEPKAIQRAKMLLDVHVKHQSKIQNFQDMREIRLKALETRRSRIEGTGYKHSIELQVDSSFIPRIIGKGGEAIRALQEKHGVNIRIVDGENPEDDRLVRIFGETQESVERARADVEFVEEALPVEPQMYNWLMGRDGRTMYMLRESAGLVYAKLDRRAQQLLLCGTQNTVQDAVAMFETHIMYYPVFHQMDEEMEQIVCQLEEYGDYNARWEWGWYRDEEDEYVQKGKGKGKGGKATGKGAKGAKAGSKGWDDGAVGAVGASAPQKPAKSSRGGGKGKNGDAWQHEEEAEEAWEEQPLVAAPRGGKGAKGSSKGAGKGAKGGAQRHAVEAQEEDEELEEEEDDEEAEPAARKGSGRRPHPRPVRSAGAAAAVGAAANGATTDRELRPVRKMGKKGVRS